MNKDKIKDRIKWDIDDIINTYSNNKKEDKIIVDIIKEVVGDIDKEKKIDYEKGFEIMYEYFDSISDEEKEEVDKRLKECGL